MVAGFVAVQFHYILSCLRIVNTEADRFFHRPATQMKFVAALESGLHFTGASLVTKMSQDEDSTISGEIDGIKTIPFNLCFSCTQQFHQLFLLNKITSSHLTESADPSPFIPIVSLSAIVTWILDQVYTHEFWTSGVSLYVGETESASTFTGR